MSYLKKSWNVVHNKTVEYAIYNSEDIFNPENDIMLIDSDIDGSNRFVVVDQFVYDIYNKQIENYFESNNINYKIVPFESSEKNKNIENYIKLFKQLDEFPINRRNEPIIAIGGGVVTDVIGFVSSCYRRGIPHIKIPTTLMGYIDASIGIKTGINFDSYKNRMGSFEPPKYVILDKYFLLTLPKRHILNGVGEILKIAVIKNHHLFELLEMYGTECIESKFQDEIGMNILNISIEDMIEELQPNLYENNLERCVDFGHTFSPALEMKDIRNLLHGEAVCIDIVFSTILSRVHSLITKSEEEKVIDLVKKLELPYYSSVITPELFWESIIERTHHRDGMQRIPLPTDIGEYCFVNDIKYNELVEACKILNSYK